MNGAEFTERAKKIVTHIAREEAARLGHDYIGTEHILLALLREGSGVGFETIQRLNVDIDLLRHEIEKLAKPGSSVPTLGDVPYTPRARKVIDLAREEAQNLGHSYIGTEHILLGLIREGEGIAYKSLDAFGITIDAARNQIISLLGGTPASAAGAKKKSKTPALDTFGRDLTELARENKLDPVIGREDEIERVLQILCRRTKNNPVLVGEPGVGKTAIVEGIAQRIVSGKAPDILSNRRLLTLDLAAVIAGTKYRGQFEERMKAIMHEIRRSDDIILFIDELHTLIGAGAAEGAIDASSMLKPALARGELQCIGATTLEDYRKYIERDGALERRFQMVIVDPPSVNDTIRILKGLRDKYQEYHDVTITEDAIEAAAKLADRYISGRFLPDKAIDVIDEAGARARLKSHMRPPDFKELEKEIESVRIEKENAIKAQEYEKAARLRDHERKLRLRYEVEKKQWEERKAQIQRENIITEEDIAYIVSKWTGIPVIKLEEKESEKLLRMTDALRHRIVGQDEALEVISRAIRRARAGLKDHKRPVGSFIFLGPTGVGKTELARALAEFLFGDEDALIRIDMSEYMEKFAVSRLVGAPPGYIGHDEGGQLTEKVRRKPYSVVLLDEIEKAHPDVFNILLQVLDDGRLTDATGRTVDFRNSVVIMTSNLGARLIHQKGTLGFHGAGAEASYQQMKEKIIGELKKTFNPEFLNRVDEVVVFHPLGKPEIIKIIELMLTEMKQRLAEQGLTLRLTEAAKEFLGTVGFDPTNGARPLRRALQRYVEDPLSEELLRGRFKEGGEIIADVQNDKIIFNVETKPIEIASSLT
ncbi:MAG: ATP-dependent Clp protease ATP-binding subunit [bacterium]|nr:ATP-dependent Clp protease ATP-binding subunit [bacterium]